MHRKFIRAVRLFPALIGLSIYAPDAVLAQGPCAQILTACEQAGFVRGGARTGNGLQIDCVRPVMAGVSQRPQASKPLPNIDAQLIAACKARNPNFGQARVPAAPGSEQPRTSSPQNKSN
jgi:hypothetical protein